MGVVLNRQELRRFSRHLGKGRACQINFQPDWLTVLYLTPVPLKVWARVADGIRVESNGLGFKLEMKKPTLTWRVLACEGLNVKMLDPTIDWRPEARNGAPLQYPTEIQVQGDAFARGVDALEVVGELERALGIEGARRIQGRFDVAADFECASPEVYDALVCFGSRELVRDSYVMRARSHRLDCKRLKRSRGMDSDPESPDGQPDKVALVGGYSTTLYLGSRAGLQLSIYRKDIDFEGNTGALLHGRWRDNGWDGKKPVARVEARFSREWVREHWIGEKKGTEVTVDDAWPLLGEMWRFATDAYRLAPAKRGGPTERRKRPSCEAWEVIRAAWDSWDGQASFPAAEQIPDVQRLIETIGKRIADLELALPKEFFDSTMDELMGNPDWLVAYKLYKSKWRNYAHGRSDKNNGSETNDAG